MNEELREAIASIEGAMMDCPHRFMVSEWDAWRAVVDAAERSMGPLLPKCPVCGADAEEWGDPDGMWHCGCRKHGAGYSSKAFAEAREHWCRMMGAE